MYTSDKAGEICARFYLNYSVTYQSDKLKQWTDNDCSAVLDLNQEYLDEQERIESERVSLEDLLNSGGSTTIDLGGGGGSSLDSNPFAGAGGLDSDPFGGSGSLDFDPFGGSRLL